MYRRFGLFLILFSWCWCIWSGEAFAQPKKKKRRHHKEATAVQQSSVTNNSDAAIADSTDVASKTKREIRKEKREKRKKERHERREQRKKARFERHHLQVAQFGQSSETDEKEPVVIRKWADIDYPTSTRKESYRVDILVPMYLDELVKNGNAVTEIPTKAQPGLNFYKGIQIAADTLKKAGFDIDIYVHDIASVQESPTALVRNKMLDSSDFVLGYVPSKDLALIAEYTKMKHINFVSVSGSPDPGIVQNPYFTTLIPTYVAQCDWMTADIDEACKGCRITVMYPMAEASNEAIAYFKADKAHKSQYRFFQYISRPDMDSLRSILDTSKSNYIIIPVTNTSFADSLLGIMNRHFSQVKIKAYGLSNWGDRNLQKKDLNNITVAIPAPFIYDLGNINVKYVNRIFKREYGGRPQDQVYLGYETMFWYANMLKRYGTIFNRQYSDNETAPFTKFDIKPHWDRQGNASFHENKKLVKLPQGK